MRIHLYFYHPQPHRVFNLIKHAFSVNTTLDILGTLEKLTHACDICHNISEKPGLFRVSLPHENVAFNILSLMDFI